MSCNVCTRCGGRLRVDIFYGDTENWGKFVALHCYRCGEIVDQVILENRQASIKKRMAMAIGEPVGSSQSVF
jgi:hypothetical protein